MDVIARGWGRLFTNPDLDAARVTFREKPRALVPKVMTAREAVERCIHDGDYLAVGCFGTNRIPTALLHEVLRQGRKRLGICGHTMTHDFQILAAGECFDRCDNAYVGGLEARGLSPHFRRYVESGRVEMTEWSNASLAWRLRAGAMGVPFLPTRSMLGSETFERSAAVQIRCPFTGVKLVALPALFPDVGLIHVHRADIYGNAHIDGISVADADIARASKRVLLTTERIIDHEEIRSDPTRTIIPAFCVDAVVEVPFGSYPGNMPYEYFSDEEHLQAWLRAEEDEDEFREFIKYYIHDTPDFNAYLERCGGAERLEQLRLIERRGHEEN
jgi:glutaconate CoA-transferase, subunit A